MKWWLHGSEAALLVGLALFAEISLPCEIPCIICFRLHGRRASPPKRDFAIDYPRSRIGGLEIFHISVLRRAGPPMTCVLDPVLLEWPENSCVKARLNPVLLLGLVLPKGLVRFHINTL